MELSAEKKAQLQRKLGKLFKEAVPDTQELQRILALPRRDWKTEQIPGVGGIDALIVALSRLLKTPQGRQQLLEIQAKFLQETYERGGGFGSIPVGEGKCVSGDTEVYDMSTGRRRRADDCGSFLTPSIDEHGRLITATAATFASGVKRCCKVILTSGLHVVLSYDHPMLTRDGWSTVNTLGEGDIVATARSFHEPEHPTKISDDEVVLAAYLLSDGGVSQAFTTFTNMTPALITECLAVSERVSGTCPTERESRTRAREFSLKKLTVFRNKWGLHGLAKEKRLPAAFWGLSTEHVKLFLSRFWACDGWLSGRNVGVALASEPMIDDLRFLLMRLGIFSRKRYKQTLLNGKLFDSWRLHLTTDGARKFVTQISVLGKEEAQEKTRIRLLDKKANTNVDIVPINPPLIYTILDEAGIVTQQGRIGDRTRSNLAKKLGAYNREKQSLSRFAFEKLCEKLNYKGKYAWLSATDIFWDRIDKVEDVGEIPVYDLSVPGTQSFVGNGVILHNTHISYLAATLLEAKRPLLVVPARLKKKTKREFKDLAHSWQGHPDYVVVSYEKLGNKNGAKVLARRAPDLIILDECHKAKNRDAGVTRKLEEWMQKYPGTKVIAMSGTVTSRSILDFAHIIRWCLPSGFQPLPRTKAELEAWAAAVDVIKPNQRRMQAGVGALVKLCNATELQLDRKGVRQAVKRRIHETPGVIATEGKGCPASLNIVLRLVDGYNARINELADGLNDDVKPNGDPITDKDLATRWMLFRTLTSGFWYTRDPPPPKPWIAARFAWKKIVREILDKHVSGLETEGLVSAAAKAKRLRYGVKEYETWKKVEGLYKDNFRTPVWEDDRVIREVDVWRKDHKGIIWVSEVALGERLEKDLGLAYYHHNACDRKGRMLMDADPRTHGCVIASVGSANEGQNLQKYNDNLIISPLPTGEGMEQLIGRTHRRGQEADEVWVEILFGCAVEWECWLQSKKDAVYQTDIDNPKRLLRATIDAQFKPPYGSGPLWRA